MAELKVQIRHSDSLSEYSGYDPTGMESSAGAFLTLDASAEAGVVPPGRYRIDQSLTLTKGWRFEPGAVLVPDNLVTVTFAQRPELTRAQHFDLSMGGSVRLPAGLQDPRWWGAKADGVSDDTKALQAAISSRGCVELLSGIYRTTAELTLLDSTTVRGLGNMWNPATGRNDTCIRYDGPLDATIAVLRASKSAVGIDPTSALSNLHISKLTLDGNNKAGWGLWGAYLSNDTTLVDITAINATQHGIQLEKWWYGMAVRLVARRNRGCGITIGRNDWGGVNGVAFIGLRGWGNGTDKAFNKTTNYEWGYGIGLYLGQGCTVVNVVGEQNDGAGLLVAMATRTACSVRGVYLEGNGKDALAEARSTRTYGLIVKGSAGSRAYTLDGVYLHGSIGQAAAQAVWLTGEAPTAVGALTLRDMAYGEYLDADWSNYKLEGYIYPGLTGSKASTLPRWSFRKLYEQHGVNLRFTGTVTAQGFQDNQGNDVTIFFIPTATVSLTTAPAVRLQDVVDGTQYFSWVLPLQMTAGTVYSTSFRSGSFGHQRLTKLVATNTADIDCFGTIGVAMRVQGGADYEL